MKKTFLLVPLLFIIQCTPVNAATQLVTTNGGASGDCTSIPCSPQYAINQAQAGDTVSFADGTYNLNSDIYTARTGGTFSTPSWSTYPTGGTVTSLETACDTYITIKAENKWGAILNGVSQGGISINHDCIEVDGLKFTGKGYYAYVNIAYNEYTQNARGFKIRNLYIDNNYDELYNLYGFLVNNASYGYIKNNYIYHLTFAPFHKGGARSHHILYEDNEVDGCHYDIFHIFGHDHIYRGNIIHDVSDPEGRHGDIFQSFGNDGVFAYNMVIENNFFYDMTNVAIGQVSREGANTADLRDWTFRNNVFANIGGRWGGDALRQRWYNNTFYKVTYGEGNHPLIFGCTGSIYDDDHCANDSEVINNLFIACTGGDPDNAGWYTTNAPVTGLVGDYNMVAKDDNAGKSGFAGKETHGVSGGNPNFANKEAPYYDFAIGSTSVAKDIGTSLNSFSVDTIGTLRPQGSAWDIGAFEYAGTDTNSPTAPSGLRVN